MNIRTREKEQSRGKTWFNSLSSSDKFSLGDQLVLGEFDWRDWFDSKPSSIFMNAVEAARMHWEIVGEGLGDIDTPYVLPKERPILLLGGVDAPFASCRCGATYTEGQWKLSLVYVGCQKVEAEGADPAHVLELKNCATCNSTLARRASLEECQP